MTVNPLNPEASEVLNRVMNGIEGATVSSYADVATALLALLPTILEKCSEQERVEFLTIIEGGLIAQMVGQSPERFAPERMH